MLELVCYVKRPNIKLLTLSLHSFEEALRADPLSALFVREKLTVQTLLRARCFDEACEFGDADSTLLSVIKAALANRDWQAFRLMVLSLLDIWIFRDSVSALTPLGASSRVALQELMDTLQSVWVLLLRRRLREHASSSPEANLSRDDLAEEALHEHTHNLQFSVFCLLCVFGLFRFRCPFPSFSVVRLIARYGSCGMNFLPRLWLQRWIASFGMVLCS